MTAPVQYYDRGGITIFRGDSREVLPALPLGLTVTDPPYNVGYHYDTYQDAIDEDAYLDLLAAVIRPPAVVILYPETLVAFAVRLGVAPSKMVAWVYNANTPRQWRAIAWFGCKPDFTLDGQEYKNKDDRRVRALRAQGRQARLYDWWQIDQVKNVSAEKVAHPCQIPVALMNRILQITPFDGPVIDPFCGAGSTLVAAQRLGRRAVGIELSENYCAISVQRLQQLPLFTNWEGQ